MKTVIVDDRNSIREFITQLLDNVDGIDIVGEAENVEKAISVINEKNLSSFYLISKCQMVMDLKC